MDDNRDWVLVGAVEDLSRQLLVLQVGKGSPLTSAFGMSTQPLLALLVLATIPRATPIFCAHLQFRKTITNDQTPITGPRIPWTKSRTTARSQYVHFHLLIPQRSHPSQAKVQLVC